MSFLQSIQTNSFSKYPIMLLHGDAGVGKTTFAAQAAGSKNKDAIFIIAEDGLGMLNVDHFPKPETAKDVNTQVLDLINGQHEYKWLVVDSITALEKKIWTDLCKADNVSSIEEVQGGYGKGYTQALIWIDQFIRNLQELRDKRGMGIILIAHTKTQTVSPPDKSSYDQYTLNINSKMADYLTTAMDLVAYMELEQIIKTTEQGFGRSQGNSVETGNRIMHCYSSKKYTSKNRYGIQKPIAMDFNLLIQTISANAPQQQN